MDHKNIIIGVVLVIVLASVFMFFNLRTETTELTGDVAREETSEVRTLRVVINPWEPHGYLDEDGVPNGIAVDVAERIFSRLNVSYEIRIIPWARALKELETGASDVSLMASYNSERAEFLYYTDAEQNYIQEIPLSFLTIADMVFFVRKQRADTFLLESLDDVTAGGYRVGAIADYSTTRDLHDAEVNVIEYPDEYVQLQALEEGVIDIALQDKAVGFAILKKTDFADKITTLPNSFFVKPQFMPFSKASDYPDIPEFRRRFLEELEKMHESGEFDEIYNSYL